MTKQQFSDYVYEQTGLRLGEDYTIEVGTHAPYTLQGFQSSGQFEGFKMVIPSYSWVHHFTKPVDHRPVAFHLKAMMHINIPHDKERV